MAERQRRATRYEVRLDYSFDRRLEAKLAQAYEPIAQTACESQARDAA